MEKLPRLPDQLRHFVVYFKNNRGKYVPKLTAHLENQP